MIEPKNPQEKRLVWELDGLLDAIRKRDWSKANYHRKDIRTLVSILGDRGKQIQRDHAEAARKLREHKKLELF